MCVHLKKLQSVEGKNTLHLTKSWGGKDIGELMTVTINNEEEVLRVKLTHDQAKELSEALLQPVKST